MEVVIIQEVMIPIGTEGMEMAIVGGCRDVRDAGLYDYRRLLVGR